jgi:nucleoside-diphosphate-sugar epimerase
VNVLVTGGSGFIGLHLVRQLRNRGDRVLVPVRSEAGRDRLAEFGDRVEAAEASLNDPEQMGALVRSFKPEATIHAGWYANPADYRTSEENLRSLQSTIGLTRILVAAGCGKLVFTGTCFEYAVADGARRETDPTDPRSLYAASKLAAGSVCQALAEAGGMEFAWARVYFPYGPGEHAARLLPMVARNLAAGEEVALTSGTQVRDQVHVEDVASALVRLLEPGVAGVFNLGTGVPVTLRETVEMLAELVGRPELLRFGAYPEQPDEPTSMYAEMSRLIALGWAPRYPTIRTGLEATLPYYLATTPPV